MLSQDNGSSWTIISPLPGVPAHGIQVGTSTYNQDSFGWREIQHALPSFGSKQLQCSNTLLKFRVTTDNAVNFGGGAIDGWEGIMIDDLSVSQAQGHQIIKHNVSNFTENSTAYYLKC